MGLAVTGAGWVTEQVEERTARRSEYAGVLVTDVNGGPGHLMLGGAGSRRVRAPGAFLWLPAEMVHSYGPGKGSWTEHWVVFHGPAVAHYEGLGLLDGGPNAIPLPEPSTVLGLMAELVEIVGGGGDGLLRDLGAAAQLHRVICAVGAVDEEARGGQSAVAALARNAYRQVGIGELAEELQVSRDTFVQQVRRVTGSAPTDYLVRLRLARAKELLAGTEHSVSEIASAVGYRDAAYFSRLFSRRVGVPPTVFRAQQWSPGAGGEGGGEAGES